MTGEKNPEATALVPIEPTKNAAVLKLQGEIAKVRDYAIARTLSTLEEVKAATDDLSIMSNMKRDLEAYRQSYVKPLQGHIKDINTFFKLISDPLAEADKVTRDKVLAFTKEQEHIRAEQEDINRKRIEAAQQEAALHGGEITESVNLVEVAPEAPKQVSTDLGTIGQRDNWTYEVFDFALLPDEYKVADTAMLNTIAKKHHDQKQIPGVRFYNEPIIAVRAR